MANNLLSMQIIAREALPILMDNLLMPNLIHKDYSNDFANVGDTVQVKRPAVFTAKDFDPATGVEIQDVNNGKILVTIDKWSDISTEVTSKELALDIADFKREVLEPAMVGLAEKINTEGLELYKDIPYFSGTAGTTPDALTDISDIRKMLNTNKVPSSMRNAVWDVDADAKFTQLDALVNVDKSGSPAALREGSIGRVYGLDNYYSQAVATHTAGGYTALADVTSTVDVDNNATATDGRAYSVATLTSAAGASTAKLLKGDLLVADGVQYVVIEDTLAAVDGVVSAKIYPALSADITDEATTFPDVTARGHVANLGFHKNAFAFVTRALPLPTDKESYSVSYNGITLRVVYGYDQKYKKNMLSLDVLYGFKTLYPELATRVLG